MVILCIIRISKNTVEAFDESYIDYAVLKSTLDVNDRLMIVSKDIANGNIYPADLSKIMQENSAVSAASTWAEVKAVITPAISVHFAVNPPAPAKMWTKVAGRIKTVENPYRSKQRSQLNIVSANYVDFIKAEYGSLRDPSLRNLPLRRSILKDLVFGATELGRINLNNTIVATNGVIHRPVVYENELYSIGATEALKSAGSNAIENVLIDFSPFGNMEIVKFSSCIKDPDKYAYKLPITSSVKGKTCFIVLAGKLFLQDEFEIADNTIILDPVRLDLDSVLLHTRAANRDRIRNTVNYTANQGEFLGRIVDPSHSTSFIVLIDTPSLLVSKIDPLYSISERMLKFPANSGGLMINKTTREIIDYSKQEESDTTIALFAERPTIYELIDENNTFPNAFGYGDTDNTDIIVDASVVISDAGYQLLDFSSR